MKYLEFTFLADWGDDRLRFREGETIAMNQDAINRAKDTKA